MIKESVLLSHYPIISTKALTSRKPLHTIKPPGFGRRKGAGMKQAYLKWTAQALSKARAKEIKISWGNLIEHFDVC